MVVPSCENTVMEKFAHPDFMRVSQHSPFLCTKVPACQRSGGWSSLRHIRRVRHPSGIYYQSAKSDHSQAAGTCGWCCINSIYSLRWCLFTLCTHSLISSWPPPLTSKWMNLSNMNECIGNIHTEASESTHTHTMRDMNEFRSCMRDRVSAYA